MAVAGDGGVAAPAPGARAIDAAATNGAKLRRGKMEAMEGSGWGEMFKEARNEYVSRTNPD